MKRAHAEIVHINGYVKTVLFTSLKYFDRVPSELPIN
jgi:hypothetical protein